MLRLCGVKTVLLTLLSLVPFQNRPAFSAARVCNHHFASKATGDTTDQFRRIRAISLSSHDPTIQMSDRISCQRHDIRRFIQRQVSPCRDANLRSLSSRSHSITGHLFTGSLTGSASKHSSCAHGWWRHATSMSEEASFFSRSAFNHQTFNMVNIFQHHHVIDSK